MKKLSQKMLEFKFEPGYEKPSETVQADVETFAIDRAKFISSFYNKWSSSTEQDINSIYNDTLLESLEDLDILTNWIYETEWDLVKPYFNHFSEVEQMFYRTNFVNGNFTINYV